MVRVFNIAFLTGAHNWVTVVRESITDFFAFLPSIQLAVPAVAGEVLIRARKSEGAWLATGVFQASAVLVFKVFALRARPIFGLALLFRNTPATKRIL